MPVAFGIKKLQIGCAIEDDKVRFYFSVTFTSIILQVSTDVLEETMMAFEDFVQSVDIAAFQKI
jgi:translation elongation factor EF-1beta